MSNKTDILKSIISLTDYGASVRFHLIRQNEYWIEESDIDKFHEPILIFTSDTGHSLARMLHP